MRRRKFVRKLTQVCLTVVAGTFTLAGRVSAQRVKLRKFVRAIPTKQYPGRVKCLDGIFEQSKWSG